MSPSPRSSVDTTQSTSSPFFHSLSQRLRKGSSASHASSQSSETRSNADLSIQPQDAESTKRYLRSILRDDWVYSTTQVHKTELKARDPSGYRLRDESVSEYESPKRNGQDDPYKFDNPDDIGAMVQRRKTRKRRLLEQEISWNEGLRIWTLRRDAWTGAVPHKPRSRSHGQASHAQHPSPREHHSRNSSESTRRSSHSAPSWPLPDQTGDTIQQSPLETHPQEFPLKDGPYLPIYPPLLPASNTLRARIKPTAYPTLYSKVVLQSLAPNVPVPLNHMIGALVEGWKAEGNWPPQPLETQSTSIIARRKNKKGESAFAKWKREQDEKKQAALQKATQQEVQWELEDNSQMGHSVRRSISGAVKKIFGGGPSEADIDRDLERMGLTFESEPHEGNEAEALQKGHV